MRCSQHILFIDDDDGGGGVVDDDSYAVFFSSLVAFKILNVGYFTEIFACNFPHRIEQSS